MDLTRLSIQRPVVVIVFYVLVTLVGIFSYTQLNYELVPRFTPEVITVVTVYPGASPKEVENQVSRVIEDALSSVESVEILASSSRENFSLVRLELIPGTNVDLILQDVQRKVGAVAGQLPDDARNPTITRFDFDDLPVLRMGINSNLPEQAFTELAENQLIPALSRLSGVAEVRLLGGRNKEVKIDVSNDMLTYYGITMLQVIQAVQTANTDVPVGSVTGAGKTRTLKVSGHFTSLKEIENTPIIHPVTKASIPLNEVAKIYEGFEEVEVISRVNRKKALGIDIKKQGGANAVEMSQLVRDEIAKLEEQYADEGLQFIISSDTSNFTLRAANAVLEDLGLAIFLVSLVMLLFLHSIRNSGIVLLSIPTSILITFILMNLLGYSLNLLTLLGLSLAIGILVDDSIVVLENIYRHLEMGKNKIQAAYEGRMEIGFTAISITLIDVVVFLPIIFSTGLVADLLRQFSVVILVSTLSSLLVSFTLAPLMVSRFGKLEVIGKDSIPGKLVGWFERRVDDFASFMTRTLEIAMKRRIVTMVVVILLLGAALSLIPAGLIGLEFIKGGDRSEFLVEVELPRGTAISRTNEVVKQIEGYLAGIPEVEGIFTTVGITSSGRVQQNTEHLAELNVRLVDKKQREKGASEIARTIKLQLEAVLPGVRIRPIDINLLGLRADDAVQVTLLSNDTELLYTEAARVADILGTISGVVEVTSTAAQQRLETQFLPDRSEMDALLVSPVMAGVTLRMAVFGNTDNSYFEADQEYPIHIQLQQKDKTTTDQLLRASVLNEKGQPIKLNQVMRASNVMAAGELERTNRSPSVTIKSQIIGRAGGQVNREFRDTIEKAGISQDIEFVFGGQTKRTQDGLTTMLWAFAASILLVYFVLVVLYDSFIYPLIILFSIPMAMIGALLALALTMEELSIFSILGLVMLVGLVGKNAILVVDFTIRLQKDGMEMKKALVQATRMRFRPVLMTNISMIIGLIPIALAAGAGSEWKNGLAWVIIGGLTSSMLLTLIVVPVVYTFFVHRIKTSRVSV